MTASKIQSRPNSTLSSSAATPRNSTFSTRNDPDQYRRSSVSGTKRCLFGAPDPAETKRLLNESLRQDRKRFIDGYGFDICTGEPVRKSSSSSQSSSMRSSPSRDSSSGSASSRDSSYGTSRNHR